MDYTRVISRRACTRIEVENAGSPLQADERDCNNLVARVGKVKKKERKRKREDEIRNVRRRCREIARSGRKQRSRNRNETRRDGNRIQLREVEEVHASLDVVPMRFSRKNRLGVLWKIYFSLLPRASATRIWDTFIYIASRFFGTVDCSHLALNCVIDEIRGISFLGRSRPELFPGIVRSLAR